ncbi:hypothetical protein HK101_006921 [Irineochytrium annulatum]|nr:hypothetical protein HK101_006921 [Irineochytrium annulatum]
MPNLDPSLPAALSLLTRLQSHLDALAAVRSALHSHLTHLANLHLQRGTLLSLSHLPPPMQPFEPSLRPRLTKTLTLRIEDARGQCLDAAEDLTRASGPLKALRRDAVAAAAARGPAVRGGDGETFGPAIGAVVEAAGWIDGVVAAHERECEVVGRMVRVMEVGTDDGASGDARVDPAIVRDRVGGVDGKSVVDIGWEQEVVDRVTVMKALAKLR